jgi:hypothetical protein
LNIIELAARLRPSPPMAALCADLTRRNQTMSAILRSTGLAAIAPIIAHGQQYAKLEAAWNRTPAVPSFTRKPIEVTVEIDNDALAVALVDGGYLSKV